MRAVHVRRLGPYQDAMVEDIAAPEPRGGEVLVRVHAAGVGFANILAIAGRHQNRAEVPFVPGTEVAGIVTACGAGVTGLAPGDRVVGSMPNGAFAEMARVAADLAFPMPAGLGFREATLFPTIYATAYAALVSEAAIAKGETLLVLGAAGATGLAAVQLGAALGCTVIACASTPEKRQVALDDGADHAVSIASMREDVLALTNGRGVDAVFDPVGGDGTMEALRVLAPEGRLLVVGFASGTIPSIPANLLLVKNISVRGVYWGYYTGWAKRPASSRAVRERDAAFETLFAMHRSGKLRPRVHSSFPLEGFREALDAIARREAIGKIVLDIYRKSCE